MIESFVDLTYRGLTLQRRVKLSHVRPSNGYLEMPTPMPVGTRISISTDEGVTLDAMVTAIHEQVGGSDHVPGMRVTPALDGDAGRSWWGARVALPELAEPIENPPPDRTQPVTVRPRSHTIPTPPPEAARAHTEPPIRVSEPIEMPVLVDDGRQTAVMDVVDPTLLDDLIPSEQPIVDDGKQTTMMESVDPAALGLDAGSSGPLAATDDDDKPSPSATPGGTVRKRRKRR